MNDNIFLGCEKDINTQDIGEIENELDVIFPIDFKNHYLKYNGGTPMHTWTPETDEWASDQVAAFIPMKYSGDGSIETTIIGVYRKMLEKEVIPEKLLPFARDWGGNFFCLNLLDGTISFFATDAFDPNLSMKDNHKKNDRKIANSFTDFVNSLEDE